MRESAFVYVWKLNVRCGCWIEGMKIGVREENAQHHVSIVMMLGLPISALENAFSFSATLIYTLPFHFHIRFHTTTQFSAFILFKIRTVGVFMLMSPIFINFWPANDDVDGTT